MSGRSAYVRKKITETKSKEKGTAARAGLKSPVPPGNSRGSEYEDSHVVDYLGPQGTGYATSNGRFLKFSDTPRDPDTNFRSPPTAFSTYSSGSQSGASEGGRRDGALTYQGPMDNFAYARVRKPTIKTEDVSGIERSGFRYAIDKKSDDVRKGLSKAFSFGKKSKKGAESEPRAQSAAGHSYMNDHDTYEHMDIPPIPTLSQTQLEAWDAENGVPPPPSMKLPPLPTSATSPSIKRWIGAGRPVQKWNKLRKDPELWDPNGDVLVYLGFRGQIPRPNPSFRLSSHIIESTESRALIQLLREGSTEDDIHMPPSPAGAPPMLSRRGNPAYTAYAHGRGQPTPPTSEDASLVDADGQISYEIYFPTPPELTKSESHRYVITTRNVFALLYQASLVGVSLYQALSDLHARLEDYMPPDADNVGMILNYLSVRGIDDCRNEPETALALLAWSESPAVRWEEGWREAFLHCVGTYGRLERCADWKHITPITRALLERACLETQLRVQSAEERLAGFAYADVWPPGGPIANSSARAAADRLQKFFLSHCTTSFGEWPPPPSGEPSADGEDVWLTRKVAQKLQKEFGALYDYLVNRDIVWDESETRSGRKWMMLSESGNKAFDPDTVDLPIQDLLIEWDNRSRFPHIPHPYPLVPDSIPPQSTPASSREKLKKSDKEKNKGAEDRALERRVQLAYTEATNIYILGSDFTQSDLIDNFVKFEKSDQIGAVDPMVARRGRWVLIYMILQTLASVSVDAPNVRYKENVTYHLSPRLKGTKIPPWKGVSNPAIEAAHELSHCWLIPQTWSAGEATAAPGERVSSMMRLMRGHGHHSPHPPPNTSTSRSGNSGWHGLSTRSVRSSGIGPPSSIYGGSSAMSTVSDDASSIQAASVPLSQVRSREGLKSARGYAPFSGRADQKGTSPDWPARSQSIRQNADLTMPSAPPTRPLPSPALNPRGTGNGGFLNLDESPPHRVSRSRNGRRRDDDSRGLTPIIRDFDELDVVDDHEP
ncbi:hypothetical protein JX266_008360 [Neoarthrinium moseri]|nr:hypothetical protein JX266_008360 [Neoarthrinium moseri]